MKIKMKVQLKSEYLKIQNETKKKMNGALMNANIRNILNGFNSRDELLPAGITINQSGDTLNTATADAKAYRFNTSYASIVNTQFNFAGVSSELYKKTEPELQRIADKGKFELGALK